MFVQGGNFAVQGTSSATIDTVYHYGNISVTGGSFSISRGSQGGSGKTVWCLYTGNFSLSNAMTIDSTSTGGGGFAKEFPPIHWSDGLGFHKLCPVEFLA